MVNLEGNDPAAPYQGADGLWRCGRHHAVLLFGSLCEDCANEQEAELIAAFTQPFRLLRASLLLLIAVVLYAVIFVPSCRHSRRIAQRSPISQSQMQSRS